MTTNDAHWRSIALFEVGCSSFHQTIDNMRAAHARRQTYQTTAFELGRLSDRTLKDLGITRGDIKRLAMEASDGGN